MQTSTNYQHQVIRTHNLMSKRTIMKRFGFDGYIKAQELAIELNAQNEGTSSYFHVQTVRITTKQTTTKIDW